MKIHSLTLALIIAAAKASAVSVLTEEFNYLDGTLTNVSGGVWTLHSSSGANVGPLVVSGKALFSQTNAPDVSAGLTGGPYSGPTLYASFVVNFSALPSGVGNYFVHFKDDGTQNFRARVYATTNGTDGTKYRVGIGNASSATPTTIIARDLDLNTDYLLVVRYNTGATPASTLWINPGSEGSAGDRTDAADSTTAVGITRFALRQSTSSGAGMGTLTLDHLIVGTAFTDVVVGGDATKNPPFISNIPDQSIPRNGATPAVPFYVIDGETAYGSLIVSATSSNTALVPVNQISFTSDGGSNRTVTATPTAGQQGVSEIIVTVTDSDNNTANRTFLVIVGAPTISSIPSQTTPKNTSIAVPFTVGDAESDVLSLTAASTNETLVPVSNILFGGSGSNRTVTITPTAGQSGLSRITVFVSDGFNTVSNSFVLTVFQTRGVDLADTFSYAEGSIVTNSSYFWNTHSGTNGDAQVLGGKLLLSGRRSEDISAFMTNAPYLRGDGWILYASFTVNFSSRPTGSGGDYFAHFKDTSAANFGARVFGLTNGAAAGKVRLGVANNATSPSAVIPVDLATNVQHTVVVRYNVGTGQSKLWVNPASENDSGATATDSAFTLDVWTYAFRQSSGIGEISIDDLKVGTAFSDVLSAPPALQIVLDHSGGGQISWSTAFPGYTLQDSTSLGSPSWSNVDEPANVSGDRYVVNLSSVSGTRFFRLAK